MSFFKDNNLFNDLFKPKGTPEQQRCDHIISSQMGDGKYFCPSCKLKSDYPLKKGRT